MPFGVEMALQSLKGTMRISAGMMVVDAPVNDGDTGGWQGILQCRW